MRVGRWSGVAAAAVVAVVGLAATGTATALIHSAEWRTARVTMGRGTAAVQAAVQAELRRYVDATGLVAAGVGALETVDPAGFEAATAPLVGLRLRGVAAAAFMVPSAPDAVAATQATWRARGLPALTLQPQGRRDEHIFAVLQRVLDQSPRTDGVDLSAVPEATDALTRARQTRATAVSEPYVMLRDRGRPTGEQQRAVIFANPVHDRAGAFQGWVIIGVRAENLMARLLEPSTATRLDISVHVGADPVPLAQLTGVGTGPTELGGTAPLQVADQTWTLRVGTDRATLPGANSDLDRGVAAGGSAATLLLALLVYVVTTGRRRLAKQVSAATADARQAEKEARRQASLLGAVMDSIGDGVAVVDERGGFLMTNPAARLLLGTHERVEVDRWQGQYGLFRADGVTPMERDEIPLVRALRGEDADHVEMVVRNADRPKGVRIDVSARPLDPRGGQPGAVAVFHDVTERRAAEEAVRRLNAELEDRVAARTAELASRAEQLRASAEQLRAANAELEAFSYSVSHDLRAPLRAVDGFARMLELDHADKLDEAGRRYVARVRAGAQTMGELIDGLLAFSRLQRQELVQEEVRLDVIVAEVWDELAPEREGRRVELEVGTLPFAIGDRRLLRQVVANLLHNALKYTRARETAVVEVGFGGGSYFVRDNGAGFDPRFADKLFQVFQRLHRAEDYEGTGVGLALASRIISRHGGRLWAESAPDRGATFYFTLKTRGATDAVHADAGAAGRGQPDRPGAGAARV